VPVLIDGNNLLYAARDAEPTDLLIGRSLLCDRLGAWSRRRREPVHVVFDGPEPATPLASQIGHPDIQVTYSGAGISADAVVIELLERDSAPRRLVVVSTDREIARAAKRRRAQPTRAEAFWRAVLRDLARPAASPTEPLEKHDGLTEEATDAWLAEFGLAEPDRPGSRDASDGDDDRHLGDE
jgi:predicted RNA-binding protein with PIN domain